MELTTNTKCGIHYY